MPTGKDWFETLLPPHFSGHIPKVPSATYTTWRIARDPETTDPFVKNTPGLVQIAIPGATKEEISITLDDNTLTVSLTPKKDSKAWHQTPTKWSFRVCEGCEFKTELLEGVLSIKIDLVKKSTPMKIPIP